MHFTHMKNWYKIVTLAKSMTKYIPTCGLILFLCNYRQKKNMRLKEIFVANDQLD